MSRYRLSFAADADLESIAAGGPNAVAILERLHGTFVMLAENREAGMLREDLLPGIRVFSPGKPANQYVVFFHPLADGVEIANVIHGSRDWLSIVSSGSN